MGSKEEEYKELFLGEALDNFEEISKLLTDLEKNPENKDVINAIFRITHTLKGNALGMGFEVVGGFAHVIEDLFGEIREGRIVLSGDIISALFRAVDTLGGLIDSLRTGNTVRHRGIQTKLEVLLKNARGETKPETQENVSAATPEIVEEDKAEQKEEKSKKKKKSKKVEDKVEAIAEVEEPEEDESEELTEELEKEEKNEEFVNDTTDEESSPSAAKITFSDLVQVPVRKLDNLLNLVGELIIERDRIIAANSHATSEYSRLNRISSDLQYSVMDVRLVQVGFLFNKFHRVARDASAVEGKKVNLELNGTDTEIDRNILQIISDSLIHIIRNSIGHGIEKPEDRKKAGKKETGTIQLNAKSESDSVIIEIIDDGIGIDVAKVKEKTIKKELLTESQANQLSENEIIMYIFEPGFSTADQVSSISGRGVGMDVVKKALDAIGGSIFVETKRGEGTTISLRLPSSMAVKGTLLFELCDETFAIPLTYTQAVGILKKSEIHKVGSGLAATYLDKTISVVFLKDIFNLDKENYGFENNILHKSYDELEEDKDLHIAICTYNNRTVGFVVDKLLQRKEIVEKPLMKPVDHIKFVSGVTILGNGNVCLVVNVAALTNFVFKNSLRG